MKKVFAIVLAISLMVSALSIATAGVAMAQDEQLQECCHLNQDIVVDGTTYKAKVAV